MKLQGQGRVCRALGSYTVLDADNVDVLERSLEMAFNTGQPVRFTIELMANCVRCGAPVLKGKITCDKCARSLETRLVEKGKEKAQ